MKPIIEMSGVSCRYGSVLAVNELNLQVPEASVYAFLGSNGAGKTTTIKTLLNIIEPSAGSIQVLDVPSTKIGPRELAQIGYVSENQKLPESLTVKDLIAYSRAIYPTWDDAFCRALLDMLDLPLDRKIGQFSRGMKIKAALLVSLAYHPRLLVFDEPFSGLDPVVRDEFITALQEILKQKNCTVFISSHDIDEVERLATWVGFIQKGKLCLSESLETVRTRFRRIQVNFPKGTLSPNFSLSEKDILPEISEDSARWVDTAYVDAETVASQIVARFPRDTVHTTSPLSLREIFITTTHLTHKAQGVAR